MRNFIQFVSFTLLMFVFATESHGQVEVSIYGGIGTTHVCSKVTNANNPQKAYQWGSSGHVGIGIGCEVAPLLYITPSVELFCLDNGATVDVDIVASNDTKPFYGYYWRRKIGCNIPVLVGGKFYLDDNLKIKCSIGPYAQLDLWTWIFNHREDAIQRYNPEGVKWINAGVMGEVAIETGEHWSYYLRPQYILTTKTDSPYLLTLSAGVRYSF